MRVTHGSILDTDNLVALEVHICIDFEHGGKLEYSEKNPPSTVEINGGNVHT